MNGMYPFKKRYLMLFIPLIIVVCVCIYRTDKQYADVVEYKHEPGEWFEFEGMKVSVKNIEKVQDGYIEERFADNEMVMSIYEGTYKEKGLIMVTLDVEGINDVIFKELVNSWHITAGIYGNDVAYMSDFANGEFTDEKEDREIVLFFMVLDEWLEECDYKVMLMSGYYPEQHNVYVDLKEQSNE